MCVCVCVCVCVYVFVCVGVLFQEKLTAWDVICTGIILVGVVLALVFGDKSNNPYTLSDLMDLYSRIPFLIFVGVFALTVIVMTVLLFRALYRLARIDKYDADTINADHRYVLIAYPTFAGFAGAASVLFAKSAIEMAKSSASGRSPDDVKSPIFALFLLGAGAAIYVQCLFLNKGLERGDALFIVPVYQVSWVFTNTVLFLPLFFPLQSSPFLAGHTNYNSITIFFFLLVSTTRFSYCCLANFFSSSFSRLWVSFIFVTIG